MDRKFNREALWQEGLELIEEVNGGKINEMIRARDAGYHKLMTAAGKSAERWRKILDIFKSHVFDLRPNVLTRAVKSCWSGLKPDFQNLHLRIGTLSLMASPQEADRKKGFRQLIRCGKQGTFQWETVIFQLIYPPNLVESWMCQALKNSAPKNEYKLFLFSFGRAMIRYLAERRKHNGHFDQADVSMMHLLVTLKGAKGAQMLLQNLGRLPHSVYVRIADADDRMSQHLNNLKERGFELAIDDPDRVVVMRKERGQPARWVTFQRDPDRQAQ